MKKCFVILILISCQQPEKEVLKCDANLKTQLEAIFNSDQLHRQDFSDEFNKYGQGSSKLGSLYELIQKTDSINALKIDTILSECGWPDISLIGSKGNEAIFLVIQHADLAYQKKHLPTINQAYLESKLNGQKMALLRDRISVGENGHQIYGTQLQSRSDHGVYGLYPLLYPEKVDSLRLSMGLDSLSTYVSQWNMEDNWRKISSERITSYNVNKN